MRRSSFAIFHVMAVIVILVGLLTGPRLGIINHDFLAFLSPLLPQGALLSIHVLFGCLLTLIAIVFTVATIRAPFRGAPSKFDKAVNYIGYLVIVLSIATGWLLWLNPESLSLVIHGLSATGIFLYLVLHGIKHTVFKGKQVLSVLLPRNALILLSCSIALVYFCGLGIKLIVADQLLRLEVAPLSRQSHLEIDGKGDEPEWLRAKPIKLTTFGGANFLDGSSEVEIKALSNHDETFFLIRWQDPTESLEHLPLEKTSDGWQVQENGFYRFDERTYYEDKFAIMLSTTCELGGDGTVQYGDAPLTDKPRNWHGKGYHASTDGRTRDLWHWKALRTNDMYLADDNFFGPPQSVALGQRRYTAGYQPDGKESGAYVMNWRWYSPTEVTPKRMPIPSPDTTERKVLDWFASETYNPQRDMAKIGEQLPSVLYRSNRFEGDRADVRARGEWHDGYWTLELVRKHQTHSPLDVELRSGVCMWVSAFDHAQIAHTRHHRAIQLRYML
ncbi:ethylbenzene dehydrogenase-related protein [Pseudoalteromonas maricaloris]|uniref:ethylbenzene dehydrogenase-related protein n=1 Tax=Pseudoalteromonas maricaloris TaxID=184924 RepID=UPI0002D67869|nr:ethylbenzene dehydrogenase-related protein [Pseudoalteromonas flavipulchra]